MKIWIILILLALLAAPNAFAGETEVRNHNDRTLRDSDDKGETDIREIITVVLSHHHEIPTREDLESRTDDAREIVFEIARDEEAFLFHRHRALRALTHWPDAEVYDYLHGLLVDEDTEDGMRHHLLPILANGFGERALDDLEPFLTEAADPQIRISAAGAISRVPGERAVEMLLSALKSETHPLVQTRLETYASRLR